jgi:hypothetical protein
VRAKEQIVRSNVEWRFARGDAGAADIQAAIDDVVAALADPGSDAARAARAAGLVPADLSGATVRVREGRQGAEPILTTIVVGIAVKVGSSAVEELWRKVIWPLLRRRLGTGVLGARLAENNGADRAGTGTAAGSGDPGGG